MAFIEVGGPTDRISQRQRWSHYFVLVFGLLSFIIGLNLRESVLGATSLYSNSQVGISARYPQNWLIDESPGSYIFRVRDPAQTVFKTTFQVDVRPVSASSTPRNILDALSLNRASVLAAYRVLSTDETFALPNETTATAMSYTFVATQNNPFLESIPVVVEGLEDAVGGQGCVAKFRAHLHVLERQAAHRAA